MQEVLAWRMWMVEEDGEGGYRLCSVIEHCPTWWKGPGAVAKCDRYEHHNPPEPECECGLWARFDHPVIERGDQWDEVRFSYWGSSYCGYAAGIIACKPPVMLAEAGLRCRAATVRRLFLAPMSHHVLAASTLAERYGCECSLVHTTRQMLHLARKEGWVREVHISKLLLKNLKKKEA
jgi:hypothetical protein